MQKASRRKYYAPSGGGERGCDCMHQHANWKEGSNKLQAVAASVVTLTNNVNIIVVKMRVKNSGEW